jgi:CRP/FNR family transcriptional regulator
MELRGDTAMAISIDSNTVSAFQSRLQALDSSILARLNDKSRAVSLIEGSPIVVEGDSATSIYRVRSGVVSIFKLLPDGRRQVTGFLYSDGFIGVTFNMEDVYGYTAEAVTRCILDVWPRPALDRLFDEVPAVRRLFLAEMADELTAAQDRMLMLARRSAEERVAVFLLAMARRQADIEGRRLDAVDIPMRWADIADYLGLTPETVSRTLSVLRDRGIIQTGQRGRIGILNWSELQSAADGTRVRNGEIYR